jgi:hypothetical protein
VKLVQAEFGWADEPVPLDQSGRVIGLAEHQQHPTQFFDRLEMTHPQQVFLERADEPFGAAIPLRRPDEGGRAFDAGSDPDFGSHDALDALVVGITSRKVNHILDADIRSFFASVSQEWLVRLVEHRIGDKRIIRLIRKWLKAGILEDEVVTVSDRGTGQGSVASPLLANVNLH